MKVVNQHYQTRITEKTELQEILEEINSPDRVNVTASPKHPTSLKDKYYPIAVTKMQAGNKPASLSIYRDNKVAINVADLKSGEGDGNRIMHAALEFAKKQGLQFEGDRRGITAKSRVRVLESMLSSALRHKSTDHISPAQNLREERLHWIEGNTEHNIAQLLDATYQNVYNALRNPDKAGSELDNFSYNPDTDQFIYRSEDGHDQVVSADNVLSVLGQAQRDGLQEYGIGGSTLLRSVYFRSGRYGNAANRETSGNINPVDKISGKTVGGPRQALLYSRIPELFGEQELRAQENAGREYDTREFEKRSDHYYDQYQTKDYTGTQNADAGSLQSVDRELGDGGQGSLFTRGQENASPVKLTGNWSGVIGHITEAITDSIPAGEIFLPNAVIEKINKARLIHIQNLGFKDVSDFISHTFQNLTAIYKETKDHKLQFDFVNAKQQPNHSVVVEAEFDRVRNRYVVITAYPRRAGKYKNLEPHWEGAQSPLPSRANSDPSDDPKITQRRAPSQGKTLTKVQISNVIRTLFKGAKNLPKINIVSSLQEALPNTSTDVPALFAPNTNQVFVEEGRHSSVEQLSKDLYHEVTAHYGLRGFYGEVKGSESFLKTS